MNRQKWLIVVATLLLIGGAAGVLIRMKTHQRLGPPGVKTCALPGSQNLEVELPEKVLNYTSEKQEVAKIVLDTLPCDTSFGDRVYKAPDGFWIRANVVLMGGDRTSIHKPQSCLRGSGFVIEKSESATVPVSRPFAYDLPVTKITVNPETPGENAPPHGIYVYWFVADNEITAQHWQRMWWMAKDLVKTGVLQRWAYVNLFAPCAPGQEAAAFERLKPFIAAAAPEFQLAPKPKSSTTAVISDAR